MRNTEIFKEICSAAVMILIGFSAISCAQTPSKVGKDVPAKDDIIECKDIDCFIEAAKTCRKATFTDNASVDISIYTLIKNDYFEIRGGTASECVLYKKLLKWESVENEAYLRELKKRGEKPPEIDQETKDANDRRMKAMTGTDGVCTFTTEKLSALFERWKDGRFSTEDFRGAKCKGSFFVPENGFPKDF